jgi:putrescine aminotransferase
MSALWHPQAHMPSVQGNELVFVRGEGPWLWDGPGKRYFDVPASLWYCNIGHGRHELGDVAARQMATLECYSNFDRLATAPTIELAERLAGLLPIREAKIFFTSGGSDGIDLAAKLVRRYWTAMGRPAKHTIVTRDRAYHGLHAFGTSITGLDLYTEGIGPLVTEAARVPPTDIEALTHLFEQRGDEIAAFFCEPVIGTGGVIPPPPGYLEEARRLCTVHDVLFVADEVITGFGRLGSIFGCTRFGIEPDLMVMAKGITSGYLPLGAVAVGPRVCEPFWAPDAELVFRHGITYSGHATGCAVALAHLDILEGESIIERAAALEGVLVDALAPLASHELVTEVRGGVGVMGGVQVRDQAVADGVKARCLEAGFLIRVISGATLQVSPPLTTEPAEIAMIAAAITDALDLELGST